MSQTILSVTLEVKPESAANLIDLIDRLHDHADKGGSEGSDYGWFMQSVPAVHFLSMNLFPSADYDPVFVIEANLDGPPGPFWKDLEAAIGPHLRAMLRCCKQPLDRSGALFQAVTTSDTQMVAPYLEARASRPSVFHQGNRGMTRPRIAAERALFLAIRDELATASANSADANSAQAIGASPYRGIEPVVIHARLRAALIGRFAWLGEVAPPRIAVAERIGDWVKLGLFAILAVLVLSLPGSAVALVAPTRRFLILLVIAAILVWLPLYRLREPLGGVIKPWSFMKLLAKLVPAIAVIVLVYLIVAAPLTALGLAAITGEVGHVVIARALRMTLLGLLSTVLVSVPGILLRVRYLERRDSSHDAPAIDPELMRQMAQREDRIAQNHMGSIVLLKPGTLRTIIVHAGHQALQLALRALPDSGIRGYLGSMRTVHFAHWAFVNNGGRLMFFSNFDQSWESYLDDFIEKAHVGLTLAWGCGAGFPPTRFLVNEGASYGTRFKNWARHSMVVSRFWYSAYPDLTVNQVERNNRIADALRKPALTAKEAAAWIDDL